MTYKETLFFVAKCLTISLEEQNKKEIENQLKTTEIDWDAVVKVSTAHLVFTTLYCNLKRANFTHLLPEELVNYMIHITDLNRERNQQIIKQAKEINELLLANNITPIFLKGTGNLLEDLYTDVAERMLGDIDFLVSQEDFKNTVRLLKKEGYSAENEIYMDFHWHYPKMVKKNRIAAVEVHKNVLKKPYTSYLDYETLIENSLSVNNCKVASFENQSLVTILQKQINDNLYFSKTISLRNLYDSFLLSVNIPSKKRDLKNKTIKKYLNNYNICAAKLLNSPKSIEYTINNDGTKYLESYLKIMANSKKELRKIAIINSYIKIKDKIKILQYSFTDEEYKSYTFRRLKNFNFYLKNLGLKKSKSNS